MLRKAGLLKQAKMATAHSRTPVTHFYFIALRHVLSHFYSIVGDFKMKIGANQFPDTFYKIISSPCTIQINFQQQFRLQDCSSDSFGTNNSPVFIKIGPEASIHVVLGLIFLLICFSPANILNENW